ncbi:MAG: ribonuclease Y [Patescibacteria group bacterium]|nr:ribonuclease Y [Patescibacteria group bacterium]
MSFFSRFNNIVSGQPTSKPHRQPKPSPKHKQKHPKPTSSPVSKIKLAKIKNKAREIIIEAKNKAFDIKRRADANAQKITQTAGKLREETLRQKAELSHRLEVVDQREKSVLSQEKIISKNLESIEETKKKQLEKLQRIAKLKKEEARKLIIKAYEKRMTRDIAETITNAEKKAKTKSEIKAKEILVEAMRHGATDYVAEYTVSLIKVKDEDMKGRVIGREGRNIRAFEKVTGVEVDLDEAGAIKLSCFDSIRREIAKVTLEKLLKDGRIQPSRIEEIYTRVKKNLEQIMHEEGEKLCHSLKIYNLPTPIIDMLGRFKYRFSYGQSMITHTLEVTKIGIKLAHEIGANVNVVRLACLLHDIGKVINDEEGTHVELGVKFLKKHQIPQAIIDCVAEHHEDKPFSSIESVLVYISDAISGSRPGARYEDHQGYLKRMTELEDIAKSFDGVKSAFAIQAGREIRVIANPQKLDDDGTVKLANDIRDKIKEDVKDFPGQIKVSAIRETKAEATTT